MTDGKPLARRTFLAAAGATAAAGGLLIAGERRAFAYSLQNYWGWCSLCSEITWATAGFTGGGDCPRQPYNGHAITSSFRYSMVYNQGTTGGLPGTPGYQAGWRWCEHCYALYWPGTNPAADCPGNNGGLGSHAPGASFNYAVPVGLSGPSYQGGWNYCTYCGCMYHAGSWGSPGGFCWVANNQTGGRSTQHNPGGNWPYVLIH